MDTEFTGSRLFQSVCGGHSLTAKFNSTENPLIEYLGSNYEFLEGDICFLN
jgi:hypothetical protein